MKLVQMLQMLIMRSLNASCGICGFANDFGIFIIFIKMSQSFDTCHKDAFWSKHYAHTLLPPLSNTLYINTYNLPKFRQFQASEEASQID